jgi:probable HAF family extracellular repeat protein
MAAGFPLATGAFLWENGYMQNLGSLGGTCTVLGDLNDRGQVVGYSYLPDDQIFHAFLWEDQQMKDLGNTFGGAIICQRLIRNRDGELQPAVEILLNTSLISDLIKNGEFAQIKEAMEQSLYPGAQTFEQALCRLYLDGVVSYEEAMSGSDSPTNLAWQINQNSPSSRVDAMEQDPKTEQRRVGADFATMTINTELLDQTH